MRLSNSSSRGPGASNTLKQLINVFRITCKLQGCFIRVGKILWPSREGVEYPCSIIWLMGCSLFTSVYVTRHHLVHKSNEYSRMDIKEHHYCILIIFVNYKAQL